MNVRRPGVALLATLMDMEMPFKPPKTVGEGSYVGTPRVRPSPVMVKVAPLVGRSAENTPIVKLLWPGDMVVGRPMMLYAFGSAVGSRMNVMRNAGVPLVTVKLRVLVVPALRVTAVLPVGRKLVSAPLNELEMS